jgi:phosphotriesterase-related protein
MWRSSSPLLNRREAITLLAAAGGIGLATTWRTAVDVASGQTTGWQATKSAKAVTFPQGAIIRTLAKDIFPGELPGGAVLIHEHIGGNYTPAQPPGPSDMLPGPVAPRNEGEYIDLMVDELKMSHADGVSCLVDAGASGRRGDRQVENLSQMSRRSGMPIVLAGGYYQDLALTKYPPQVARMTGDELVDEFVHDANTQRWGAFGEIASSQQMQPDERKVIRAIGKAHLRTNLSIFTHTPHEGCPTCALEQLDLFESLGVDSRRVCIGHLATIKPDAEPLAQTAKALAKRGAFLGFDTVGHLMGRSAIPEAHKVKHFLAVLEAGYEDHLLLSADSTPVPQLKANWGNGYSSVVLQFVPKLRYAGVKDATLHKVLVDNPRRFLAFVPRKSS